MPSNSEYFFAEMSQVVYSFMALISCSSSSSFVRSVNSSVRTTSADESGNDDWVDIDTDTDYYEDQFLRPRAVVGNKGSRAGTLDRAQSFVR